ncbi:MAG: RagB/SusD family nutrient uptake outer membrane protein [Chitinophagaceae bacterium]
MTFSSIHKTGRFMLVLVLPVLLITASCNKYLDKKPSDGLLVPSTLADLQAIVDNQRGCTMVPRWLELPGDNYFLPTAIYNSRNEEIRRNYIWDGGIEASFSTEVPAVWGNPYMVIYESNLVLEYLPKVTVKESEAEKYRSVQGHAYFQRGFMFFSLAQLYCPAYSATASTDMGLPLRLGTGTSDKVPRASVEATYRQIIADLEKAAELLPDVQIVPMRPNKAAAYAALARTYLSMRDYVNAGLNADKSLVIQSTLLDYNMLDPAAGMNTLSTALNNPEISFVAAVNFNGVFDEAPAARVDTVLYQAFHNNDLRKTINYISDGGAYHVWRGNLWSGNLYPGMISPGFATDEMWLTRAECRARNADVSGAMSDLNTLLRKRWRTGTFTDMTATSAADALSKVLMERRKSLAFRGMRWTDLRRFNLEGANITLKRIVNNITYTLPPNDLRWTLLIPNREILASGLPQNPR